MRSFRFVELDGCGGGWRVFSMIVFFSSVVGLNFFSLRVEDVIR